MINNIFKNIYYKSKKSKKIFLIEKNITYGEFYEITKQYLNFLKKNLKKKEVVCISSKYSLEMISLIFSCCINGNVITFLNPNSSMREKKHVIKNSGCRIIFYDNSSKIMSLKNAKRLKSFKYKKLKQKNLIFNSSIQLLIYTSGTTSVPKGVMISNNAIFNNIKSIKDNLKLKSSDKTIIFSPPAYAMAISQILTAMDSMCSVVFYNHGLKFPSDLVKKIKSNKITILNLSISSFRIILKYLKKREQFLSPRIVMSGGMKYDLNDYKNFKNTFPKAKLINFYGCTENSPRISHCCLEKKFLYNDIFPVGKPLRNVKIKIKKKNNEEFGKIFVSGKSIMSGYLNLPSLNKEKFANNWFDTGDLGFLKGGQLYILGREDNTFSVGHEKLCPEEVETIIKKKFNISEIVITKKKDPILIWHPICLIQKEKKENVDKSKIENFFQKNFSSFKIPRKILFINKIPRNTYGKIDRKLIEKKVNL